LAFLTLALSDIPELSIESEGRRYPRRRHPLDVWMPRMLDGSSAPVSLHAGTVLLCPPISLRTSAVGKIPCDRPPFAPPFTICSYPSFAYSEPCPWPNLPPVSADFACLIAVIFLELCFRTRSCPFRNPFKKESLLSNLKVRLVGISLSPVLDRRPTLRNGKFDDFCLEVFFVQ